MSSEELDQARKAIAETLTSQGKSEEYIEDFLSQYDRNLKNIEVWKAAKLLLEGWQYMRKDKLTEGETVSLRADENGKPIFHVSPEAMGWMLDM